MCSTCPAVVGRCITVVFVLGFHFCCLTSVWCSAHIAMTELPVPSSGNECEYLPVELRPVPVKLLVALRMSLENSKDLCRLIYEYEKADCVGCVQTNRQGKDACSPLLFPVNQWKFFQYRVDSSRPLPQLMTLREQSGMYPPIYLRRGNVSRAWHYDLRQH